jgi:hypothetical protein
MGAVTRIFPPLTPSIPRFAGLWTGSTLSHRKIGKELIKIRKLLFKISSHQKREDS